MLTLTFLLRSVAGSDVALQSLANGHFDRKKNLSYFSASIFKNDLNDYIFSSSVVFILVYIESEQTKQRVDIKLLNFMKINMLHTVHEHFTNLNALQGA